MQTIKHLSSVINLKFQLHKVRNAGAQLTYVHFGGTLATKQMHTQAWFSSEMGEPALCPSSTQTNLIQLFFRANTVQYYIYTLRYSLTFF